MISQSLRKKITGHMLWQYPDLGTLVLGVLVVFLGLGTAWPVLTIYMQGKGIDVGGIGLTTAAYMGANFLFQMPFGWLSDRMGRKPLLIFGLAVHGLVSLFYLQIGDMNGFLLLRFIEGAGAASMMPAARAHIMDAVPSDKRGAAFGLLGSALNIGTLCGPLVGGLMAGWTGMTGPFWFGFGSSLLAIALLIPTVHDRRGAFKEVDKLNDNADNEAPARVNWRAVAPVFVNSAGTGIIWGLFAVIWNIWMHDLGASLEVIGLSYTVFALPLVLFGPWAGRLADRRNRVWLILIPSLVNAAIYVTYGFSSNIPLIFVLGLVEGLGITILSPAGDSYMADVVPARLRGRLQGMANSANTAVAFASAIICGVLYDLNPLYVFLLLGAGTVLTSVTAALLMAPFERKLRPPRPPRLQQPQEESTRLPEDAALAA